MMPKPEIYDADLKVIIQIKTKFQHEVYTAYVSYFMTNHHRGVW